MSVIETVRYRVKAGVTKEEALAAWQASQPFARAQEGFLSRRLAVTGDGEFLDLVEWETMDAAQKAAANFDPGKHPELLALVQVLDESTMVMSHYEELGRI